MPSFDSSLLSRGGPVMWVLAAVGLVALVLFVERALALHRRQIRSTDFIRGVKNAVLKRRITEAITECEETPGPVAAVAKAALIHYDGDEQTLRLAMQEAALTEIPLLERRLGSLAAIGQVAPMLGLLGTLLGMATTFQAFSQGGDYATARVLADGMWQALFTSIASLLLAVPVHLGLHFLRGRVRALVRDVEWVANELTQFLLRERPALEQRPVEAGALASAPPPSVPAPQPTAAR